MIEAAGGAVWRVSGRHLEVLLVHRPRRRDWSLPKGKLDRHESHLDGALREVFEETGLWCSAGLELPQSVYRDRHARLKRVRFWAMEPTTGEFTPNHEVDKVKWVRLDRVAEFASYDRDLTVLADLELATLSHAPA
jgi:8-oxo-dGTP pyrophosphatase MutT (NUDIX family)